MKAASFGAAGGTAGGPAQARPVLLLPMRGSVPAIRRRMLAWWRTNTSTAMVKDSLTTPNSSRISASEGGKAKAASDASDDIRAMAGDQQPDGAGGQADRPSGCDQHPKAGGHALSAFEPQPNRKQVSQNGGEASQQGGVLIVHSARAISTAAAPFSPSNTKVAAARPFAPGAQNIGRADIAGPDAADIAQTGRLWSAAAQRGSSPAGNPGGGRSAPSADRQTSRRLCPPFITGCVTPPRSHSTSETTRLCLRRSIGVQGVDALRQTWKNPEFAFP